MNIKLLTEHHLEFLSLKEAAQARLSQHWSKMPHGWKSHAMAQMTNFKVPISTGKTQITGKTAEIPERLKNNRESLIGDY